MIIHTIMREGHCLDPQVMDGIARNDCQLMPVVSPTDCQHRIDRANVFDNWKASMMYASDPFVGMDSDVILYPGAIAELVHVWRMVDFVVAKSTAITNDLQHILWMARPEILERIPLAFDEKSQACSICQWIGQIKESPYKYEEIKMPLACCQRTTLTRRSQPCPNQNRR